MPDITITPGTFNPPGPLAESYGLPGFSRIPFQQVRRPPLQYNSREPASAVIPPAAVDNIEFTLWNPYYLVLVGPKIDASSTFTVAGARYVPDGSYSNDESYEAFYYNVPTTPLPSGDFVESSGVSGYAEGDDSSIRSTGRASYTYPIEITLVGCTDGATYEVKGRYPGVTTPIDFTQVSSTLWSAIVASNAIMTQGVPEFDLDGILTGMTAGECAMTQECEIQLYRDGALYDKINLDAGSRAPVAWNVIAPGTWDPAVHGVSPAATGVQAIQLTLYGFQASPAQTAAAAVVPAVAGIVSWFRTSYATQGLLTTP